MVAPRKLGDSDSQDDKKHNMSNTCDHCKSELSINVDHVDEEGQEKGSIIQRRVTSNADSKELSHDYPDEQYWYLLASLLDRLFLLVYIIVISLSTIMFKPWFDS